MENPEKITGILERYFDSLQFRNIMIICEKLSKNIELNRRKLSYPVYRALILRIEALKLCTGQLIDVDKKLLVDITLDSIIGIDNILNRMKKNEI